MPEHVCDGAGTAGGFEVEFIFGDGRCKSCEFLRDLFRVADQLKRKCGSLNRLRAHFV